MILAVCLSPPALHPLFLPTLSASSLCSSIISKPHLNKHTVENHFRGGVFVPYDHVNHCRKEHTLPHDRQLNEPINRLQWNLFPPTEVWCCFIVVASLSFCSSCAMLTDSGDLLVIIISRKQQCSYRPIIEEEMRSTFYKLPSEQIYCVCEGSNYINSTFHTFIPYEHGQYVIMWLLHLTSGQQKKESWSLFLQLVHTQ